MALSKELDPRFAKAFGIFAGVLAFLIIFLFFASLGKLVPAHSDSSYLILYADEMLKGNWFLRGWDLTTVSFYTELPFYLVAVKWMGVKPDLIRLVPAFIYTLNVALVCALVWKYRIGKGYWIYLPVVAFLILPSNGIWPMALNGAIHMVTLTIGLCMLLVLNDRFILEKPSRKVWLFVICLLGVWGDLAFAFLFILPLLAAGIALHRKDSASAKSFGLSVAAPAIIGAACGHALVLAARVAGLGAPVGNGVQMFDEKHVLVHKGQILVDSWINFFGPDMWGTPLGFISFAKVVLGFGVIWWILAAVEAWRKSDSGFDLFAVSMPFVTAGAVMVSKHGGGGDETRFIVPAFFVTAVLLSRYAQRHAGARTWRIAPVVTAAAALAVSARFVTDNRTMLAGDAYMSEYKLASKLLLDRGLTRGFGDYWASQVMRVASEGKLEVMPVEFSAINHVIPNSWASDRSWFSDPSGRYIVFHGAVGSTLQQHFFSRLIGKKIVEPNPKLRQKGLLVNFARAYWGEPSEQLEAGNLEILIWDKDVRVRDSDVPEFLRPTESVR